MRSLPLIVALTALASTLLTVESVAATFVVDATLDDADANVGDGVCRSVAGACTLRAAFEETVAIDGGESVEIQFGGAQSPQFLLGSPLPTLRGDVFINGTTVAGYPLDPETLEEGGPRLTINGFLIDSGANGIEITSGNLRVEAINVIRFQGSGIRVGRNATAQVGWSFLQGNTFGATLEGQSTIGSRVSTSGQLIRFAPNMISGNREDGLRFLGDAAGSEVVDNVIGLSFDLRRSLANGRSGINATFVNSLLIQGNRVGASGATGILILGDRSTLRGNVVGGFAVDTGTLRSGDNGIAIIGNSHLVEQNGVSSSGQNGISLLGSDSDIRNNNISGSGGTGLTESGAGGNRIQSNGADTNFAGDLRIGGDGTIARGNRALGGIRNTDGTSARILVTGDDVVLEDNLVGAFADDPSLDGDFISIVPGPGIELRGDRVEARFNRVGASGGAEIFVNSAEEAVLADNMIGLPGQRTDTGPGVLLAGAGTRFEDNTLRQQNDVAIFVEETGDTVLEANVVEGNERLVNVNPAILLAASTGTVSVLDNEIAGFVEAGIVAEDGTDAPRTLRRNEIRDAQVPIDLGNDGPDVNDEGDDDDGVNRRLNYPVLSNGSVAPGGGTVFLTVSLESIARPRTRVEVEQFEPATDFANQSGRPGRFVVTAALMSGTSGNFSIPGAGTAGELVAVATDSDGNSSEVSPAFRYAPPSELLRSGFEADEGPAR
ncbi:MAG: right-handed parallel beta-helix repeat-containing protein [Pseudomonadota bacterium]